MKNTTKWQYFGDVDMLAYGGKYFRCIGKRQYQCIELINMDEACGRDNKGQPKYTVALRLVDLNALSQANIDSACGCCGIDEKNPSDELLAEACDSYGCHAPLEQWSGNNARQLLRQAYKAARELLDAERLKAQLEKPVNRIGSSAREIMTGDIYSAIQRGCESGQTDARIMAKMYGVDQEVIDNVRPADWLPYFCGYMDAMHDRAKQTDPDISPEYIRGFDRAEMVKAGKSPAPNWIKSEQPA